MRTFIVTIWFTLWFFVGFYAMAAGPQTTIDEFIDNRDCDSTGKQCTSTLLVTCAFGKQLSFRVSRDRLDKINIDSLYKIIIAECGR